MAAGKRAGKGRGRSLQEIVISMVEEQQDPENGRGSEPAPRQVDESEADPDARPGREGSSERAGGK
jgi:hypothetical protein